MRDPYGSLTHEICAQSDASSLRIYLVAQLHGDVTTELRPPHFFAANEPVRVVVDGVVDHSVGIWGTHERL